MITRTPLVALFCLLLAGCGQSTAPAHPDAAVEEKVVNVFNWHDYIKPEVLRKFAAKYGVQVHYTVFDSNNTLAARLLAGHSGYDVVFPSGAYLESMIAAGAFRPLDKALLPGLKYLDPVIMQRLAAHDPGNTHAVDYTWGITGIAYDEAKVRARLPQAPVASWSMLFDPKVAAHFADCGIGLYESPNVIVPSVLAWLGEPPNSEDPARLERAQTALMAVRPYIRKIGSGSLVDDLATGELCVIIASNGDAMQAQERAQERGLRAPQNTGLDAFPDRAVTRKRARQAAGSPESAACNGLFICVAPEMRNEMAIAQNLGSILPSVVQTEPIP